MELNMAGHVVLTETISCESPKTMFFENIQTFQRAIIPLIYY